MTRKEEPSTHAVAVVRMPLRAILGSGKAPCLDFGKRTDRVDFPGARGLRTPRESSTEQLPAYSVHRSGRGRQDTRSCGAFWPAGAGQ